MADWINAEEAAQLSGYHIETIYHHCRQHESFRAEKRGSWWIDRTSFLEFVEAKKTKVTMTGKNSFLKELDQAMKNRAAHYAIGAVYETFIPSQWGVFRRFAGNKIVISIPEESDPISLDIAYKVARAELIAQTLADEREIDASKILEITERVLSKLENMRAIRTTINSTVTSLSDVHIKLGTMATEIKEDLAELTSVFEKAEE